MSWYLTDWSEQAGYTAYLLLFSVFRAQRCFDRTTARLGIVFFIQTKYINIWKIILQDSPKKMRGKTIISEIVWNSCATSVPIFGFFLV